MRTMGGSFFRKQKAQNELDLQREREADAKKLARRAKAEAKLAGLQGAMVVDSESAAEDREMKPTKKFGKVMQFKCIAEKEHILATKNQKKILRIIFLY